MSLCSSLCGEAGLGWTAEGSLPVESGAVFLPDSPYSQPCDPGLSPPHQKGLLPSP